MNIVAIIPARMGSSRFPGKPMADLCGLPMIQHVYMRSKQSDIINDIYVATCDAEIKNAVEAFGGKAIMTSDAHERASDRVAEAMIKIESNMDKKIDIVVMIQGDEPLVFPEMIDLAVAPLVEDPSVMITNLMAPLETREEHEDPNEVKVVVDLKDNAIYFSREPIPSWKKSAVDVPMLKQVCIIPFRRDFLIKFNELPQTPLEIVESVDMLRLIENGYTVRMVPTDYETFSVDTPQDLERVASIMATDTLFQQYAS
jgi:3-deoxy-manno-octulosonate cytidylyltransferase (CMP-KDO synthetase)